MTCSQGPGKAGRAGRGHTRKPPGAWRTRTPAVVTVALGATQVRCGLAVRAVYVGPWRFHTSGFCFHTGYRRMNERGKGLMKTYFTAVIPSPKQSPVPNTDVLSLTSPAGSHDGRGPNLHTHTFTHSNWNFVLSFSPQQRSEFTQPLYICFLSCAATLPVTQMVIERDRSRISHSSKMFLALELTESRVVSCLVKQSLCPLTPSLTLLSLSVPFLSLFVCPGRKTPCVVNVLLSLVPLFRLLSLSVLYQVSLSLSVSHSLCHTLK